MIAVRDFIKADELCLVVTDEVSTMTSLLVAYIHERLKQLMNCDEAFGRVTVILIGDFMQLPPVGQPIYKSALYTALAKNNRLANKLRRKSDGDQRKKQSVVPNELMLTESKGVELFNKFYLMPLKGQERSKSDPVQKDMVERLTKGMALTVDDLKQIKVLTKKDFENDITWNEAPVLVTFNRERVDLTSTCANNFAPLREVHVIIWPLEIKDWHNKPDLELYPDARKTPFFGAYLSVVLQHT
eukprot:14669579-Ditylum_brightwellii.AAC.1